MPPWSRRLAVAQKRRASAASVHAAHARTGAPSNAGGELRARTRRRAPTMASVPAQASTFRRTASSQNGWSSSPWPKRPASTSFAHTLLFYRNTGRMGAPERVSSEARGPSVDCPARRVVTWVGPTEREQRELHGRRRVWGIDDGGSRFD